MKKYLRLKHVVYIFVVILFWLSLFTPTSASDPIVTIADGVGNITAGDKERARDAAIWGALRQAVEQSLGTFLQSESIVENYQLISDNIISDTAGYIQKYYILEEFYQDELYRVKIKAYVASGKLENDLAAVGLLMLQKHKPRVMVIIQEKRLDRRRVSDPVSETEIIKRLLKKGFKIVDQAQVKKIRYNDQVRAALAGNDQIAAKIGGHYGAEVVIIGEAFSEFAASGGILGKMISCRASVYARAIRTDNGEIIAAEGKQAGGIDISKNIAAEKALQNSGGQLSDFLIKQILSKWRSDVIDTTSVQLVVTGIDYRQFVKFKDVLKSTVRGVRAVHQRTFLGNRAVIDIDLKGDSQALADELSLRDFGNFKVSIINFTSNRLDLKVLKR